MPSQNYDLENNILNMGSKPKYVPIEDPVDESLDSDFDDALDNFFTDDSDLNLESESELDSVPDLPANLSMKERFASQLVGELPRCPECAKLLRKRTLSRCDYCGFSFSYLEKLLPTDQLPSLEAILDFSKRLESAEENRILEVISFIKKRYPQFIPKICLLPLQSNVQVHQMALWMINQCPPLEKEEQRDKEWYVLLLIDTAKNRCALAYGYEAEIFIPDETAWKLVSNLNRSLKKERIGEPIVDLLSEIVPLLDSTKRMLKRKYKNFKRKN